MDFFNKLGVKAGETFHNIKESDTTKKALNYAEIPGLTVQVGKQEAIVKKAYQEIGEAYYKDFKNNAATSAYAEQMNTITRALRKIDALKAEIEEKKKYDASKERSKELESPQETMRSTVVIPEKVISEETRADVQIPEVTVENFVSGTEE